MDHLEVNEHVGPLNRPEVDQDFTGTAEINGWGYLANILHAVDSITLQAVTIPFVDYETCKKPYQELYGDVFREDCMICAGSKGKGDCYGDIGGPLVCQDKEKGQVLCGMSSWGEGCGKEEYPSVYARVSHMVDFINENL